MIDNNSNNNSNNNKDSFKFCCSSDLFDLIVQVDYNSNSWEKTIYI